MAPRQAASRKRKHDNAEFKPQYCMHLTDGWWTDETPQEDRSLGGATKEATPGNIGSALRQEVIRERRRKQMAEKRAAEKAKRRRPEQLRRAKLASDERDATTALSKMLALTRADSPLPPSDEEFYDSDDGSTDDNAQWRFVDPDEQLRAYLDEQQMTGHQVDPQSDVEEDLVEEGPDGKEGIHTPSKAPARIQSGQPLSRRRAMRGRLRLPTPTSRSPTPERYEKLPSFYDKLWAAVESKRGRAI
ncbi:hypothetical protein C8R44DRAFT_723460 [Mycena epipterygia]|nr:hypothetical protein C8R44DRAFT_751237 [Mycena epipterygia]KAJ7145512.1 hypothetical protein C8R44DRAFT_723460 [Mycena epipterygia]